jgi:BASS family bile acid:Na+ symporter
MTSYLQQLADLTVPAFVVSTMLLAGLSQPLSEVISPLKKPLPVGLALMVNFIFAPLVAIILVSIVPLRPAHATGILMTGAAAGAPFLPKLAEISLGSIAYSVALMVLLMGGSIVFMPVALPLMIPGLSASPWVIAKPLLVAMLIPLAAGFALAHLNYAWVPGVRSAAKMVSSVSTVLLVVLMVALNFKTLVGTLGSFAVGTYLLYLLIIIGAAYLIGAVDTPTQNVFALGSAGRNVPACLIVAGASMSDPAVTVMLIVAFVLNLVVLLGLARAMRPKAPAAAGL